MGKQAQCQGFIVDLVIKAKKELAPEDVCHIANHISHSPKIVLLDETKVAGIRGTTSLSDNRLPGLWAQFHGLNQNIFTAPVGYSICETQNTAGTLLSPIVAHLET